MSGSAREALSDVCEWSGCSWGFAREVGRPCQMSGSGRGTLGDVRQWSLDPPRCLGVVGSPSRMPGVVGRPPGCPGVVGRPSRMSGSGREALPDVR